MSSVNSFTCIGRLVRNAELRHTQTGTPVTDFTLAVDRTYPDSQGNYGVDYIDFTAWRGTAEKVCNKYRKGDLISAEGELQINHWKDRDGNPRTSARIVVSNVRKLTSPSGSTPTPDAPPAPNYSGIPDDEVSPFDRDEDLPY